MIGEPMNFVHLTHIGSGEMGAGDGLAMVMREWGKLDKCLWTVTLFLKVQVRNETLSGEARIWNSSPGHQLWKPKIWHFRSLDLGYLIFINTVLLFIGVGDIYLIS